MKPLIAMPQHRTLARPSRLLSLLPLFSHPTSFHQGKPLQSGRHEPCQATLPYLLQQVFEATPILRSCAHLWVIRLDATLNLFKEICCHTLAHAYTVHIHVVFLYIVYIFSDASGYGLDTLFSVEQP